MKHRKHLIMLNMSFAYDWKRGIVNRNFHIAQQLIQSNNFDTIVLVDFMPFTFKKKVKVMLREKPWKKTAETVVKGSTWQLSQDQSRKNVYTFSGTSMKHFDNALQAAGIALGDGSETLLWSYNPLLSEYFADEQFEKSERIFDAVDNWIEHPSYTKHTEQLQKAYAQIARSADAIFTVSESLVDLFGKTENVFYVPNGVDVAHFHGAVCHIESLLKARGPVIGYHGNIQNRVNFQIIKYLAEKHTEYQFVLAGFVWKESRGVVNELKKYKNVTIIEDAPYKKLPEIIACFDVAIIPHIIDGFTQSMNPLKMYEYIAAGKPVVSTAIAGADQLGDLISLAVSPEDFSRLITEHLEEDSAERMERRMAAAENHSWESRFAIMNTVISRYEK